GAYLGSLRRGAEHPHARGINPVEPLLLHVPQRAFAQRCLHVDDDFDLHDRSSETSTLEPWLLDAVHAKAVGGEDGTRAARVPQRTIDELERLAAQDPDAQHGLLPAVSSSPQLSALQRLI